MRILLDECVNHSLRNYLPGHEVHSARFAGFGGLKNGELLQAAEAAGVEVVLTVDQGFQYQQNLAGRKLAVIIFSTRSIALQDLLPPESINRPRTRWPRRHAWRGNSSVLAY
jgi:predicted nuclease of predicted toxin-antitoxin system